MINIDLERLLDIHLRLNIGTISGKDYIEVIDVYKSLKTKIEDQLVKADNWDNIDRENSYGDPNEEKYE